MNPEKILELFNGDYSYIDRSKPKDQKYHDALSKCVVLQEKLATLVDKEIFELIDKEIEYQNEVSCIEMEHAYIEGFSLAVMLILESISNK